MRLTATDIACERGGREILSRLSLAVAAGELLAVTGPNGAGKSTLLRLLAGLLRPSAGEIRLEPKEDVPRAQRVHYLGHLDGLKDGFTVAENLDFWRKLDDRPDRPSTEALEAVGLRALSETPVHYLSAGQRRRIAIARLLVTKRPVWLLDEPSASLDSAADGRLGAIISDAQARGTIIIAASHQSLPVTPTTTLQLGTSA